MNNSSITRAVIALAVINSVLAVWIATVSKPSNTQFVLTPLYQVVPKGSVWTTEELAEIKAEMPNALEARDMQKAYARLGSTLTVDDVIKGIDALSDTPISLSSDQQAHIKTQIEELKDDHKNMIEVQRELIRLEHRLVQQSTSWGVVP